MELQRDENGRFTNLLSMAAPLPLSDESDVTEAMGSPMSRTHSRHMSDWSVGSSSGQQPAAAAAAAQPSGSPGSGGAEPAGQPKIQPQFRPIKSPPKPAPLPEAAPEARSAAAEGQDSEMVQILLQQVGLARLFARVVSRLVGNNALHVQGVSIS